MNNNIIITEDPFRVLEASKTSPNSATMFLRVNGKEKFSSTIGVSNLKSTNKLARDDEFVGKDIERR